MTTLSVSRDTIADVVAREGWAVTAPCIPQLVLDRLLAELAPLAARATREEAGGPRGGLRNLFEIAPLVRALACSAPVRDVAEAVLGEHCFAVRALLFDKTEEANWKVVWHQDVTIAVRERASVIGFGPWSDKAGIPHVQPPTELLERMLAVRVHLDDSGPESGPVRVLPGSHRVGRLSAASIDDWRAGAEEVECVAERGAILAFRPLLLHASSPATEPTHRRVVHFEFAAEPLPAPLEWHDEVA